MRKVAFHPTNPSIAYATSGNNFYRSTDGGLTWQVTSCSHGGYIPDFVVDPNNGDRVFIGTLNTIISTSTDGGVTCTGVSGLPSSIDPNGANFLQMSGDGTLYAVTGAGLLRNQNSGGWQARTLPATGMIKLRVDPVDGNSLVAYTTGGGFRSTDGGGTWQPIALPSDTADLAFSIQGPKKLFAATSSGILVSIDYGNTWSPMGPNTATTSIALDPADSQIFYAATARDGLFSTANQGGTWDSIQNGARVGQVQSIAVSSITPNVLLVAGSEGVVRSSNAGGTWTSVNTGIVATSIEKMVVSPASQRIYLYTTASGIFALDHGAAWARIVNPDGLAAALSSNGLGLFDLTTSGGLLDQIYATTNNGFARSNDGGDHWEWVNAPVGAIDHMSVSPTNQDEILIAGAMGGMSRSVDGGVNWSPVAGFPGLHIGTTVARAPHCACTILAGAIRLSNGSNGFSIPVGIYRSANGGTDWVLLPSSTTLGYVTKIEFDPRTDQTIYVVAGNALYESVDGGDSWSALNVGTRFVDSLSVDALRPDTVYAGGDGSVARSVDGGQTWQTIYTPLQPSDGIGGLLANPFKAHTVLGSKGWGGISELTVATDLDVHVDLSSIGSEGKRSLTYEVRNLGPVHATDLETVIHLPSSATDISASTSSGSCAVQSVTVTCTKAVLLAADTLQIKVSTAISEKSPTEIVATTAAGEFDPVDSNNAVRTSVTTGPGSDLSITAAGPTSVNEGSDVNYSFVVANSGPQTATAAAATIQVPAGLTVTGAIASQGSCSVNGSVVNCALGDLKASANATVALTVSFAAQGTYAIHASVATAANDSVASNDSAVVATTVNAVPSSNANTGGTSSNTVGGGTQSGGGGGGSLSLWLLGALLVLERRRRTLPSRTVGPGRTFVHSHE